MTLSRSLRSATDTYIGWSAAALASHILSVAAQRLPRVDRSRYPGAYNRAANGPLMESGGQRKISVAAGLAPPVMRYE